jgi:hypothetical protein
VTAKWTSVKPTQPGRYVTRYRDGARWSRETVVHVVRSGRGLSVQPEGFAPVPMSEIGEDELQWKEQS